LLPDKADRLIAAAASHLQPLLSFPMGTGVRMAEAIELNCTPFVVATPFGFEIAHVCFGEPSIATTFSVPLFAGDLDFASCRFFAGESVVVALSAASYALRRDLAGEIKSLAVLAPDDPDWHRSASKSTLTD
jgi:hypothetical protein